MKKNVVLVLSFIIFTLSYSQKSDTKILGVFQKDACGVWCWYSWGGTPNKWNGKILPNETYAKMRGIPIVVGWNELEPKPGVINWDLIDDVIKKAAANKINYILT